ncbi:MAG: hypothetical protein K2X67_19690 [Burkholderiales bacterium]|jgi:hypothetical protein|nr:hypothetical protein [Burkholderiales bacterium]
MNKKIALALFGVALAGASVAAQAGDRHGRGWDDRGFHSRGHGHHHGQWHPKHHRYWHPAPHGYRHGPGFHGYRGHHYDRNGVTIILRGHL